MEELTTLYKEFRTIDGIGVCKVYFINGIPFSFDEEDVPNSLPDVLKAEEKPHLSNEALYKGSSYLIEEGLMWISYWRMPMKIYLTTYERLKTNNTRQSTTPHAGGARQAPRRQCLRAS